MGLAKTLEAVRRHFHWPTLRTDVFQHVRSCHQCQVNKLSTQKPAGLLKPLQIPGRPWASVSMDFIVQLPKTKSGHDAILVFVDRLTKMVHFAPTTVTCTAADTAKLFIHHVVRAHGIPLSIVSDRDSRFTSRFWQATIPFLGTKLHMSTAFHPQSDGQTERVNKVLEDTIRHFVSPRQDDWDEYLDGAEFAINNAMHESTKNTPFFLNSGQHPLTPATMETDSHVPSAKEWLLRLHDSVRSAKLCLEAAQQRMKATADGRRREAPAYQRGDKVLLQTKNLNLKSTGTKKLLPKWIGPFSIVKVVNEVVVELDLPIPLRIHPTFHTSLVKPYIENGQPQLPPPTTLFEDGAVGYNVECILSHRTIKRGKATTRNAKGKRNHRGISIRREFLVKWEGYGTDHNSYEPEENFEGNTLLTEYLANLNLDPALDE